MMNLAMTIFTMTFFYDDDFINKVTIFINEMAKFYDDDFDIINKVTIFINKMTIYYDDDFDIIDNLKVTN